LPVSIPQDHFQPVAAGPLQRLQTTHDARCIQAENV
jgi:hypothetical protein